MNYFNSPEKKISFIISIIIHISIICIFFFNGMKYMDPKPMEGSVAISFGNDDYGMNNNVTKSSSKPKTKHIEEKILTQDIEDAPITSTKEDIKTEKTEKLVSNFFSDNNTSKNKGNDKKFGFKGKESGVVGNTYGKGLGEAGEGYRLGNRNPINKPQPKYISNDQGTVIIRIIVNPQGNVIQAEIELKGTTVSDTKLWEEAKRAALNTKWEPGPNSPQRMEGTIIYNFLINK